MKDGESFRCLWVAIAGCALIVAGCDDRETATPAAVIDSRSTVGQVCKIAAELFSVDRSTLTFSTSLADLRADELDFVELVMELEDHFEISIPDDTAERLLGANDWQQGMKNVTMAKLASLVEEQKQVSQANGAQAPETQVKVFLNPLVILLAGAEKQKGRPLDREEVLEVRDKAAFIMMSPEQAQKFYESSDSQAPVTRLNPDRIWEEWQEIRGQLE